MQQSSLFSMWPFQSRGKPWNQKTAHADYLTQDPRTQFYFLFKHCIPQNTSPTICKKYRGVRRCTPSSTRGAGGRSRQRSCEGPWPRGQDGPQPCPCPQSDSRSPGPFSAPCGSFTETRGTGGWGDLSKLVRRCSCCPGFVFPAAFPTD